MVVVLRKAILLFSCEFSAEDMEEVFEVGQLRNMRMIKRNEKRTDFGGFFLAERAGSLVRRLL